MSKPTTINARIIEDLYCEALVLSDEVRNTFDLSGRNGRGDGLETHEAATARAELSSEALKTTTRMMHALAWLLNQRAYLAGELSELQLRRYGRLTPDNAAAPQRDGLLSPDMRDLILATQQFHARLQRLDREWRRDDALPPLVALQERLGSALAR